MKKYIWLLLVAYAVFLTACKPAGVSEDQQQELIKQYEMFLTPPGIAVTITSDDCPAVEVLTGTQVMWINADTERLEVTIEHLDGTGVVTDTEKISMDPESMMTKVFSEPATYRYTCSGDMDWYSTITVKE